ncbi:AAA family ATPase [Luteimicrobium sp. NPDC057192]|uniref:AAA family ATPase n=1 Tax=Luteimicrobium sp. NPDC057192 TaxID=3346042 RepID=UPI00362DD54F
MPTLLLLNGAPGTGKSTLARRWADTRPLSLVLDIDRLRALLGAWQDDVLAAGQRARRLAVAAAWAQLSSGGDVVVPQLLVRPELVEELDGLATAAGARFVEVVLTASPEELAARLADRIGASGSGGSGSGDADPWSALEDGPPTVERLRVLADAVEGLVATRPGTHRVVSAPGDVDATLGRLVAAVGAAG